MVDGGGRFWRRVMYGIAFLLVLGLVIWTLDKCVPPDDPDDPPQTAIEVAAVWKDREAASFNLVLDRFTSGDPADVRYTPFSGETYAQDLLDRIAARNPPDIAIVPQAGLLYELVRIQALEPIEDFARVVVEENYDRVWVDQGSVRGTLYGVWFKASHKSLLWYRPGALAGAGLTPPRTWGDLQTVLQTLSRNQATPLAVAGGDGWTLTDWFENVYMRTAGPEKYQQLACHQIRWTDPSVKEALATLAQVVGRSEWLAGGRTGARATTFPKAVEQVFGNPPSASMMYAGDFITGQLPQGTQEGIDTGFVDFPSISGSKKAVLAAGDVAVMLRDTEASRRFMRFLATADAAEPWAQAGGFISPNRRLDLTAYRDDSSLVHARAMKETELLRYDLSDQLPASFAGAGGQGMWKILQDFLLAPTNIDGITERLQEGATVTNAGARCR